MRPLAGMLMVVVAACGAGAAAPLDLAAQADRAQLQEALRASGFCDRRGPRSRREVYLPCERPGLVLGQRWVEVELRRDRVILLRRLERYPDADSALQRWNELIAARRRVDGPPSGEARRRLAALRGVPEHAKAWEVFASREGALVGLYLRAPPDESEADIIEELVPGAGPGPLESTP